MNNISEFRQKKNITQQDFAQHCGWLPSRLSNYENGYRTLSVPDANKIIDKLNELDIKCSFSEVFPSIRKLESEGA